MRRLRWRTGELVRGMEGAVGYVAAVRKGYIVVAWDELSRKRHPHLPERSKLPHENFLVRLNP